jgi:hypothetical protein
MYEFRPSGGHQGSVPYEVHVGFYAIFGDKFKGLRFGTRRIG